ncbi:hypothetical protein KW805_01170 [Candidatus Pacearchaeota archaeon]|nr:hypothetical protein [Candidatus Pacearchaeota archaeon]
MKNKLEVFLDQYNEGKHAAEDELLRENRKKDRKPNGYWNYMEHVIQEVRRVMYENDWTELPDHNDLVKRGYGYLSGAIKKQGGYHSLRKKLGHKAKIVTSRYWEDFNRVEREAKKIMKRHNFDILPGCQTLSKLGYGSFAVGVIKYHGGLRILRSKLGQEQIAREPGTWSDLQRTITETKKVMRKLGTDTLPPANKLNKKGFGYLVKAITRHYGGFRKFREELGEEQLQIEKGTWLDINYGIQKAKEVMKENHLDSLPNYLKLKELGHSDLSAAIHRHYGGFRKFRETLGQGQKKLGEGILKDQGYVIKQLEAIAREHHLEVLPSTYFLRNHSHSSLAAAVTKYHGGMRKLRADAGEQQVKHEEGYWMDIKNVAKEVLVIMKKHGFTELPSQRKLTELEYTAIASCISQHWSFPELRKQLAAYLSQEPITHALEGLLESYAGESHGE